jgi:NADH-quinone oxidoreductase subunit H
VLGPIMAMAPALALWAVVPFRDGWVLANVDAGVLYLLAVTSFGVYGIIIAGWASNSKYAFLRRHACLGTDDFLRSLDGPRLITVLMVSNSLNLSDIVMAQDKGMFAAAWPGFPVLELAAAAADVRSST